MKNAASHSDFASTSSRALVGLGLIVTHVSSAQETVAPDQPLSEVATFYANAQSYWDTGTITTTFASESSTPRTLSQRFRTAYDRDSGHFRLEFEDTGATGTGSQYVIVSDGDQTRVWWELKGAVESAPDLNQALLGASFLSSGLTEIVPPLLDAALLNTPNLSGIDLEDGPHVQGDRVHFQGQWNGRDTQLVFDADEPRLVEVRQVSDFAGLKTERTVTFDSVAIDAPLPESTFALVEGAPDWDWEPQSEVSTTESTEVADRSDSGAAPAVEISETDRAEAEPTTEELSPSTQEESAVADVATEVQEQTEPSEPISISETAEAIDEPDAGNTEALAASLADVEPTEPADAPASAEPTPEETTAVASAETPDNTESDPDIDPPVQAESDPGPTAVATTTETSEAQSLETLDNPSVNADTEVIALDADAPASETTDTVQNPQTAVASAERVVPTEAPATLIEAPIESEPQETPALLPSVNLVDAVNEWMAHPALARIGATLEELALRLVEIEENAQPQPKPTIGRFQLGSYGPYGAALVIDTVTGQVWEMGSDSSLSESFLAPKIPDPTTFDAERLTRIASAAPSAQPDAEPAAACPSFFSCDSGEAQGVWLRVDADTWVRRQTGYEDYRYRVSHRIAVENQVGAVVMLENTDAALPTPQVVFIPDMADEAGALFTLSNTSGRPTWVAAGEITHME